MRLASTQRHETSRNRPAIGTATPTGHSIAQGGHRSVGDRPGRGCLREFRIPVGRGLSKTGAPWIAATTNPRSSLQSLCGAEEAAGGAAHEGTPDQGLSNRFMDLETCGAVDPPAVWGTLPSLSCLEAPNPVGVELSEARTSSAATRRGRDRPMETVPLAPYNKPPHDVAPIWSFSMNPAFCSSPTWPAPGLRKGIPPRTLPLQTGSALGHQCAGRVAQAQAGGALSQVAPPQSHGAGCPSVPATVAPASARSRGPAVGSGNHSAPKSRQTLDLRPSQAPGGRVPGLCARTQSGGLCVEPGRPRLGEQCAGGFAPAQRNAPPHGATHTGLATTPVVLCLRVRSAVGTVNISII